MRNANARHPELLAVQRRELARIRGEKGLRWGSSHAVTARAGALPSIHLCYWSYPS
nr:hypothetical protein [Streptomyces sp. TLI_235]